MDASETADEIQKLRQRVHDIAETVHVHGVKLEVGRIEMVNLKDVVENLATTTATRETVKSESAILQLKLDQIGSDVGGMKRNQNTVTLFIVLAFLGGVVGLVWK